MGNTVQDLSAVRDHANTVISIDPVDDQAADVTGTSFALANNEGSGGVYIEAHVGPGSFTPTAANKVELEVLESTDNSTFTAAPNDSLSRVQLTTLTPAAATNTGTFAVVDGVLRDDKIYSTMYHPSSAAITHVTVRANFSGTVTGGIPLSVAIGPSAAPRYGPTDD